jgi:hypothetical protein
MRLNNTSLFSQIVLDESAKVPAAVQIFKTGSFTHPNYGKFEITTTFLSDVLTNFKNRVRGIDIAFDYFHDSDKEASGWVRSLELRENGTQLWATVDWTPKAATMLAQRELRYFSPDFTFKWQDPETGKTFKNVLFGGGLTNRPFLKEMQPIVADEIKGEKMTELEKLQAKLKEAEAEKLKLSEANADMTAKMADMVPKSAPGDDPAALKAKIAELTAALEKMKMEHETMMAEKVKADAALKCQEKKSEFAKLLAEGKACAAQEKAYLEGDMTEFIKLAEPVNLKAGGTSAAGDTTPDEEKVFKLAEEKMKADPTREFGDCVLEARKEIKK